MSLLSELNNKNEGENFLKINPDGRYYLLETARWVKFLAIFAMVIMGLMIVGSLFGGFALLSLSRQNLSGGNGVAAAAVGSSFFSIVFLFIMIGLYVYPIYALYKFSVQSKRALFNYDEELLNDSFRHLKGFFQYIGILTLIFIIIYAFFFIFIGLGVLMAV